MASLTQKNRPLALTTPLGPDALLAIRLRGREEISHLFSFRVDVLAENRTEVPFDKLLGRPISVRFEMPGAPVRHFSGICRGVTQGACDNDFTHYELEMVPSLWLLTKRFQSRIFQHMSVPEILRKVLTGLNVAFEIHGTFHPRDYCVQYRESDFAFASRLMEEEGIYYYFRHGEQGHLLVLANTPQSHALVLGGDRVLFEEITGGNRPQERVHLWSKRQALASGKVTLWDHCFELPHQHLEATQTVQDSVTIGEATHTIRLGNDGLEVADYPGAYAQRFDGIDRGGAARPDDLKKIFEDNKRTAGIRAQQEVVPSIAVEGAGNCRQFSAGHRFNLTTLDQTKKRGLKADGSYVLTAVEHDARDEGAYRTGGQTPFHYENRFTCLPVDLPFRPARVTPKPSVRGSQTAVVVGPPGTEVFCDKYGRVKVQFHWDREGQKNAESSCWIRVGTIWAGKRWGAIHVPRIGQEVIVDFLEGDPDQPIIIGSVYNAEQMPSYLGEGPDSKHAHDPHLSGIKSHTTPNGAGFNELRFNDGKDHEQIFLHAEKDLDVRVKHVHRETVLSDRHLTVGVEGQKQGNQHDEIHADKHLRVHGDHKEHIGGSMQLLVGEASGGGDQDIVLKGTRREHIEGQSHRHVKGSHTEKIEGQTSVTFVAGRKEKVAADSHLHVTNDRREKIDGTQSLSVGKDQHEKVGGVHAVEAGKEIHLKAGSKIIIESGVQLTLKGPGGHIDISPGGITIQGTIVKLNVGGPAGTGSGSKPQLPDEPAAVDEAHPASPVPPALADDSVSGSKSAP